MRGGGRGASQSRTSRSPLPADAGRGRSRAFVKPHRDVVVANAPVSYGALELTVGILPDVPEGATVLDQVAEAGYAGIDLGPIGYFGYGEELAGNLARPQLQTPRRHPPPPPAAARGRLLRAAVQRSGEDAELRARSGRAARRVRCGERGRRRAASAAPPCGCRK